MKNQLKNIDYFLYFLYNKERFGGFKVSTIDWVMQLGDLNKIIYLLKVFAILMSTYILFLKILNQKKKLKISIVLGICVITFIASSIRYIFNNYYNVIFRILALTLLVKSYKKDFVYNLITIMISMSINYIVLFISSVILFVPMVIFKINNEFLDFIILMFIYTILLYKIYKIKKIRNGLIFLQKKIENEYFSFTILCISVVVMLIAIIIPEYKYNFTLNIVMSFIIIAIIMYITIKKSLELYYKQTLLIQELEENKNENNRLRNEVKKLEEENLNFSKKSHSLAHKQKSLEKKIKRLMQNMENAEELGVCNQVEKLSFELYQKPENIEIEKTGIENIDDMLNCMKEECLENNIEFELKLYGNIYQMVNNFITKEEVEILIADHIKDAIIAINYSKNENRSILARIGKIDGIYSIFIYDSGIEFEPKVLKELGKKPITTHLDSGGSGMGFMNTFDTLKKYKASLIIEEYNKPCRENYTKVIKIKFDGKGEFKIDSYRKNVEISKKIEK